MDSLESQFMRRYSLESDISAKLVALAVFLGTEISVASITWWLLKFPPRSAQRLAGAAAGIVLLAGSSIGQVFLFRTSVHIRNPLHDNFFFYLLLGQLIVAVMIMVCLEWLAEHTRKRLRSRDQMTT